MEKRISYLLLAVILLIATGVKAQTPNATDKVLMETSTGAAVYQYSNIKSDVIGALSIPAAGMVYSNGSAFQTATVRTQYAEPTNGLGSGILYNTTGTGAHTIAVPANFPVLNQNTTGNAATATLATNVTTNAAMTGDVTSNGSTNATTIATSAVTSAKILDGTIATADVADAAITTVKILDANVTAAKLATGAVNLAGTTVTGVLPESLGGTGSATKNFVDLTTNQATIAGNKTFTGSTTLSNLTVSQTTQTINSDITATATLGSTDNARTIICPSACTITLGSWSVGKEIKLFIDRTSVGVVTLTQSGETISGLASPTFTNNGVGLVIRLTKTKSAYWVAETNMQSN